MRRRARQIRRPALAALAIVMSGAFALGPSERASACSCVALTDEEAFANADAVFTGELLEVLTPPGDSFSSSDPERFVFEVDGVFKGDVFARQSVVTARDGASCGLEISGRGPFVVFARTQPDGVTSGAEPGELSSTLCSGTRDLASGVPPAGFGEAGPPMAGSSPLGRSGDGRPVAWIVVGGGVLVLAGAVIALSLRRRIRTAA